MASNGTSITVVGNLTGPLDLRFTSNGVAVANGTIASTPRTFNRQANEWEDGTTEFWPITIWREAAEQATESLDKGTRVIATGNVKVDEWEDKNGGGKRTRMVIDVDEIGPSLKYATARVAKAQRGGGGNQGGYGGGQGGGYGGGFGGGQGYGAPQGGQGGYGSQGGAFGGYPAQGNPGGGYPAQGNPGGGYPAQGNQGGGYGGNQGGGSGGQNQGQRPSANHPPAANQGGPFTGGNQGAGPGGTDPGIWGDDNGDQDPPF